MVKRKKPVYHQRLENVNVELTLNWEGKVTNLVVEPTGMEFNVSLDTGEVTVANWGSLEGVKG